MGNLAYKQNQEMWQESKVITQSVLKPYFYFFVIALLYIGYFVFPRDLSPKSILQLVCILAFAFAAIYAGQFIFAKVEVFSTGYRMKMWFSNRHLEFKSIDRTLYKEVQFHFGELQLVCQNRNYRLTPGQVGAKEIAESLFQYRAGLISSEDLKKFSEDIVKFNHYWDATPYKPQLSNLIYFAAPPLLANLLWWLSGAETKMKNFKYMVGFNFGVAACIYISCASMASVALSLTYYYRLFKLNKAYRDLAIEKRIYQVKIGAYLTISSLLLFSLVGLVCYKKHNKAYDYKKYICEPKYSLPA